MLPVPNLGFLAMPPLSILVIALICSNSVGLVLRRRRRRRRLRCRLRLRRRRRRRHFADMSRHGASRINMSDCRRHASEEESSTVSCKIKTPTFNAGELNPLNINIDGLEALGSG